METTDKIKILVYGTLKQGEYNYDRLLQAFGEDALVKIEDRTLEGFDMYDLGYYPAITAGHGSIQCELLEVSKAAAQFIKYMEVNAGYEEKIIDNERIYIYKRPLEGFRKIETGDWTGEYTD